jgi:hypothetical protein
MSRLSPPTTITPSQVGDLGPAHEVTATRYRTIVADPPWDIKAGPRSLHDPGERSRDLLYPTRGLDWGVASVEELEEAQ